MGSGPHRLARVSPAAAVIVVLMTIFAAPAAAETSATVPIATFAMFTDRCAGGQQSQAVENIVRNFDGLLGPRSSLPVPVVSLNPGCNNPPPAALSPIISASNTLSSSPSGSATVSAQALGNALLTEEADAGVYFAATVPLSAPATSVEVTIPYTTAGATFTDSPPDDRADTLVVLTPTLPINCADGSYGSMEPYQQQGSIELLPLHTRVPPGSGTRSGLRFYCPDGSRVVSSVGFKLAVVVVTYSASGQTESASVDFRMHDVTATITP